MPSNETQDSVSPGAQAGTLEGYVPAELVSSFEDRFGTMPKVYRAPGRINIIGEHTDYNQGLVMPASINLFTWTAINPRPDRMLVIHSTSFDESYELHLDDDPSSPRGEWSDYVWGVALMLTQHGIPLRGANLLIQGNVPLGSGLSSSASLEVSVGMALAANAGQNIDLTELALLCQRAENDFVGARCGIMDQFVSCRGKRDSALLLDCRDLTYRSLPLPQGARLVIANTMVRHRLANGEYNRRRVECQLAVKALSRRLAGIQSLRDVTPESLEANGDRLDSTLLQRCRHVVSENVRVLDAAEALEQGDVARLGELMNASHHSLKDDYEVGCRELDLMAELARSAQGVYGARMTGGGFGGCVIALVDADCVAGFEEFVRPRYREKTGLDPWIHVADVVDGASQILSPGPPQESASNSGTDSSGNASKNAATPGSKVPDSPN